jgi:hypothetical protein
MKMEGQSRMNRNIIVSLIAGLAGGLIVHFTAPPAAFAQNPTPVAKEIRAQSFTLTDASDHMVGTFSVEPVLGRSSAIIRNPGLPDQTIERFSPMRIVLRDARGREIWTAGDSAVRPIGER